MADILIRGMGMPKTCGDCPLSALRMDCKLTGRDISHDWIKRKIPDWCPLIPLPEGHGRLIDADRLTKRLNDFVEWCRDDRRPGAFFVMDCPLPDSPTIVPAEGGTDDERVM